MENYYNCIYMYTSPSGKKYIGKAVDFNRRHNEHIYSSHREKAVDYNVPFHKAIRKYGIENFIINILKENLTDDELRYWEDYYIETLDTYVNHNKGYNIAKGGQGGDLTKGKTEEENNERKRKISEKNSGKNNAMYGKQRPKHSKRMNGKNNPNIGNLIDRYDKENNLIDTKYRFEYKDMGFNADSISSCCQWYECGENKEEWFKIHKNHPCKTVGLKGEKFIFKYHKDIE